MKMNFKYYLSLLTIFFLSCEQNNTIATIDCAGVVGGLYEIDDCGDCSDPYSVDWNTSCTDCSGILNGEAYYDSCGQCICSPTDYPAGPPLGSLCFYPIECNDNNDPSCSDGIANYNDNESFYIGSDINGNFIEGDFNNLTFYTIPCIHDCNGILGGNSYLDDCNRCVSENEYPSVDTDLDGECDGIDSNLDGICDICTDNPANQPHSECTISDNGQCVCYGNNCDECIDYNIDECGVCNGNGIDSDQDGLCDNLDLNNDGSIDDTCLLLTALPNGQDCGQCNGIIDECGICNGTGIDSDQDGICDDIDSCLVGSGAIDECGICDGSGINENACDCNNNTLDCLNVCGGEAVIDGCGQCSGYYISANNFAHPAVDYDNDGICDGSDADNGLLSESACNQIANSVWYGVQNQAIATCGDGLCDADAFGNCDGNDTCLNDSDNDTDGDGVCGNIDQCEGFDDSIDLDFDGVIDGCDLCQGDNASGDLDGDGECSDIDEDDDNDGISDNVDICPNDADDDADQDGICGDIDSCEGFNDNIDADGDGIADGCDNCEGFDDNIDADGDGIADGCDSCPNDADDDADADGICGDIDQCEGFDDNIDTDTDGIADGCDTCLNDSDNDTDGDGICGDIDTCPLDDNNDADNDGICGDIDSCEGFDDNLDTDNDGTPNGCDDDDDNDNVSDDNDCAPLDDTKSEIDCNDECGGISIIDSNGTCCIGGTIDSCNLCYYSGFDENNNPFIFYQSVDADSDGICDGVDVNEDGDCDICTDVGIPHAQCTENDINECVCYGNTCDTCIGNNFDECGVCDGNGVDADQDDICDDLDDCIGNLYDECGICNGIGTDLDGDGLCDNVDTDGDGIIDDTCIDTDNDFICDHLDNCLDIDNDQLCDNDSDGDGQIDDDCVGSYDQCGVCNGNGTSCLISDGCDLDNNNIYIYENSENNNYELWYNLDFDIDILSFSLLNNNIDDNSIAGGAYENTGSTQISGGDDNIIISGAPIPGGCGTLFTFDTILPSDSLVIDVLDFLDTNGNSITVSNCNNCIYEFQDPCDAYPTLSTNSISLLYDGSVIYNIDFNLDQFEWTVDGATSINSVSDGDSENNAFDFVLIPGTNTLNSFATNSIIPPGCGLLLDMELDQYNNISLNNVVFKDDFSNSINMTIIDANDCQELVDECGVCGGDGIPQGECDCDGNIIDECGVCNGSGIAEGACDCDGNIDADGDGICDTNNFDASTMPNNTIAIDEAGNVYYNIDFNIGGFQWDIEGTTVSATSGGDAAAAGFTVQGAGVTVLGFSFTGGFIPAGYGILTEMTLAGAPSGLTEIVFSDDLGIQQTVNYYSIP